MTGRSTGADDVDIKAVIGAPRAFEEYGRHSMALDSLTSHMDKQTSEINDIMRHSIATNYSFHSKVYNNFLYYKYVSDFSIDKNIIINKYLFILERSNS